MVAALYMQTTSDFYGLVGDTAELSRRADKVGKEGVALPWLLLNHEWLRLLAKSVKCKGIGLPPGCNMISA